MRPSAAVNDYRGIGERPSRGVGGLDDDAGAAVGQRVLRQRGGRRRLRRKGAANISAAPAASDNMNMYRRNKYIIYISAWQK
ncbi:MAG: hypothetical protein L6V80_02590 [Bacteroidales bacterium]|nr:MAG: hypothetical protein L6V80_02590 [Bacteroidales bacterium]